MKLNTLEKLAQCLEAGGPEVIVPDAIRERANQALTRMLEWSA
jgi:quinolinate synthase